MPATRAPTPRSRDVFHHIHDLDAAAIDRVIARLEFRGWDTTFAAWRDQYLDRMVLARGSRVLDLGCGTGVVARALASRPGLAARITAADHSAALLQAARRFAADEGLADAVDFMQADALAVPLPDASFDAVIAHTLVSHVGDPAAVVAEAARLLRAGGRLAVFDGDYASLTFAHPDERLARAAEEGLIAVLVEQPRVMRDLPRLLAKAGLELTSATPHAYADIGSASFFLNMAQSYAPLAAGAGALSVDDADAWLAGLRDAAEHGTFFGASNYYTYIARRP
jgi:SAM-dependent methyltransferase